MVSLAILKGVSFIAGDLITPGAILEVTASGLVFLPVLLRCTSGILILNPEGNCIPRDGSRCAVQHFGIPLCVTGLVRCGHAESVGRVGKRRHARLIIKHNLHLIYLFICRIQRNIPFCLFFISTIVCENVVGPEVKPVDLINALGITIRQSILVIHGRCSSRSICGINTHITGILIRIVVKGTAFNLLALVIHKLECVSRRDCNCKCAVGIRLSNCFCRHIQDFISHCLIVILQTDSNIVCASFSAQIRRSKCRVFACGASVRCTLFVERNLNLMVHAMIGLLLQGGGHHIRITFRIDHRSAGIQILGQIAILRRPNKVFVILDAAIDSCLDILLGRIIMTLQRQIADNLRRNGSRLGIIVWRVAQGNRSAIIPRHGIEDYIPV